MFQFVCLFYFICIAEFRVFNRAKDRIVSAGDRKQIVGIDGTQNKQSEWNDNQYMVWWDWWQKMKKKFR